MEITTIDHFLSYYSSVRERTNKVIRVIPPDVMDFSYKPGKFTIADEIRHIAAIERYMFAENVAGRKSCYKGCGKNLADGYEAILRFFEDLHNQSLAIFKALSDEDLKKKCMTPGNVQITIWKWLRAMVEHEIHHRAQVYIYLNLLDIKTPPMFGLNAEEVEMNSI